MAVVAASPTRQPQQPQQQSPDSPRILQRLTRVFKEPLRSASRSRSQSTSRSATPNSSISRIPLDTPSQRPSNDGTATPASSVPAQSPVVSESRRSIVEKVRQEKEQDDETRDRYGELTTMPVELCSIEDISEMTEGTEVCFRARIHTQRRLSAAHDFLLFRDQTHSIQGVLSHTTPNMVKWVQRLHPESYVQVTGTLQKPPNEPVRSATHSNLEVAVHSIYLLSPADHLPFDNYHNTDSSMNQRLSARVLDLRHPTNQAIFKVRAMMVRKFRESLENQGFMEIQTPKLQPAATESGAEVFKVNYFGRRAFLAQSPQLAKQMTISSDFKRVYEVGPIFRAENSNTHRHLTEYTGLDLEMALVNSYTELIKVVDQTLKNIFAAVQSMPEVQVVRDRFPTKDLVWLDETLVIPFPEGIQMLRDDGRDVEMEDLSTRDEIRLGELVKEKYKTDYYILDKFPANARPFYTHKDENDPKFTHSFDIFLRGQEICTGGERIHDYERLLASMRSASIPEAGMDEYLSAFKFGAPPHGGAGLGLERLVMQLLDLGDVRYATLFHRDPKSLPSYLPGLPHPEADTTKAREDGSFSPPPLEHLIANYGDATNTSWLDDRFQIWRHKTGAAVGYVVQDKFCMITGDPLCDESQYTNIIQDFVEFVKAELQLKPVWMLVSYRVQDILARQLKWRTLTCTEEQRVNTDEHAASFKQASRRVQREGIKVSEVRPDADFIKRADQAIVEWHRAREGHKQKQVHLTDVRPWVDQEHRRYFAAERDGVVHALVVLAQLAPRHGWQIKWALDFPNSPNGTIEVLVEKALGAISGPVTFGVGVSEKLHAGAELHGVRAKFLAHTYDVVAKSLGLAKKAEFREKFGAQGEQVYICYPKGALSVRDLKQIVAFFQ